MYKNNLGQSMFELLVAIGVVAMVLVALISLSTRAVGNTNFSTNKNRATEFTQDAAEWVRTERDIDWIIFKNRAPAFVGEANIYCFPDVSAGWPGIGACVVDADPPIYKVLENDGITRSEFWREVVLKNVDDNSVDVSVITYWFDGVGRRESRSTVTLTNWKNN